MQLRSVVFLIALITPLQIDAQKPDAKASEMSLDIPVMTVCEALKTRNQQHGKTMIVVGKLESTDEGSWLSEDCGKRIVTDGYTWANTISLTYVRSEAVPPPNLPDRFIWNVPLLLTKLKEVERTTELRVLKQYNYADKWFAVLGRFETRIPLRVVVGGSGRLMGYGFGHLNYAPAQLIAPDNGYYELKPKKR